MNPLTLAIITALVQALVNNNQQLDQQRQLGFRNNVVGGAIALAVSRPYTVLVRPFRLAGRGIGALLGFQRAVPNQQGAEFLQNPPWFFQFNPADATHRAIIRNFLVPNQLPNNYPAENINLFYINGHCYRVLTTIIQVAGSILVIYLIYRIMRTGYSFIRRDFTRAEAEQERSYRQKVKKRLQDLESEQKRLKQDSLD